MYIKHYFKTTVNIREIARLSKQVVQSKTKIFCLFFALHVLEKETIQNIFIC